MIKQWICASILLDKAYILRRRIITEEARMAGWGQIVQNHSTMINFNFTLRARGKVPFHCCMQVCDSGSNKTEA